MGSDQADDGPPDERASAGVQGAGAAGARAELLGRVVAEAARHGLADRSLREIASAVGTSHRMLHYHFGSREGLVTAVVEAVEAAQRGALGQLSTSATDAAGLIRQLWHQVSSAELRPFVQLFFEAVAYASRQGTGSGFTTPWLADAEAAADRIGAEFDPVAARLGIAVTRGLLIDVLCGEADAATASLERFIELWSRASAETNG